MKLFQPLTREKKINIVAKIIFIGFIAAVIYHFFISGVILHQDYPFNTFLFRPWDRFNDLFNGYNHCKDSFFAPYQPGKLRQMFPFLQLVYCLFGFIDAFAVLYFFIGFSIIAFFFITLENLKSNSIAVTLIYSIIFTLFSYPLLFTLDRANTEILVFFLLNYFIWFFRIKKYTLSAIVLSIAIAMKPFPAIFLLLFLRGKRFKEVILTIIFTSVLTLIALFSFNGSVMDNVNNLKNSLGLYNKYYVIGHEGIYYGHSLWGLIKIILFVLFGKISFSILEVIYYIYQVVILTTTFIYSVYILFIEKIFWKKVTVLVIALCLFTPVSPDYRLLYFYIPLFLFINKETYEKLDWVYLILLSILLVPKNYFSTFEIGSGVAVNPMIMLIIFCTIIIDGLIKNRVMPTILAKFKK